jgi:carbon storage regulator CsrA
VVLILERRLGQSIVLPGQTPAEDVEVVVMELLEQRVKLGVIAHRDQGIFRRELWVRIQTEKEQEANGRTHQ